MAHLDFEVVPKKDQSFGSQGVGETPKREIRVILADPEKRKPTLEHGIWYSYTKPNSGSRVSLRLKPTRAKVKFAQQGSRVGWKERGVLYGLRRGMRRSMEAYHSYGKTITGRINTKKPKNVKSVSKKPKVLREEYPQFKGREFQSKGWNIAIFQTKNKLFAVVREEIDGLEGEVQTFKKLHKAMQLYAQWVSWSKHQPSLAG